MKLCHVLRWMLFGCIIKCCLAAPTVTTQSLYTATTGESVTLKCTVTPSTLQFSITKVYWRRSGIIQNITSTTNTAKYSGSTPSDPSLTILSATLSDAGSYQCCAEDSTQNTGYSQQTTLNVISIATTTELPTNEATVATSEAETVEPALSKESVLTTTSLTDERTVTTTQSTASLNVISVMCADPGGVANAIYTLSGITVGSTASYTCVSGYHYGSGNLQRVCQLNGTWDGVPPVCVVNTTITTDLLTNEVTVPKSQSATVEPAVSKESPFTTTPLTDERTVTNSQSTMGLNVNSEPSVVTVNNKTIVMLNKFDSITLLCNVDVDSKITLLSTKTYKRLNFQFSTFGETGTTETIGPMFYGNKTMYPGLYVCRVGHEGKVTISPLSSLRKAK